MRIEEKRCSIINCNKYIFATLDEFAENNWSAFAIPSNSKPTYFCPNHQEECSIQIKKALEKMQNE